MSLIDDWIREILDYVESMNAFDDLKYLSYELNHEKGFKLNTKLHYESHKIKGKEPFKRLVRKINMGG